MYTYKEGDKVIYDDQYGKGEGVVIGVAFHPEPPIGAGFIVRPTDNSIPNETYPYSVRVVFEVHMKLATSEDTNEKSDTLPWEQHDQTVDAIDKDL
ncbi:MAG: hypothetical protein K9J13_16165 [Saprospiraceae bacterium]|nr:hypothetical protein [Saprospiraceae bacterium]